MMRLFAVLAFAILAGCATGPSLSELQGSGRLPALASDHGRLFFYRVDRVGFAVRPDIRLDGKVVGSSVPNGFFYVDVASGSHQVATSTEVERTLSFAIDKGETKYIKTSVSLGVFVGHIIPELVSKDEATEAFKNLVYIGGASK